MFLVVSLVLLLSLTITLFVACGSRERKTAHKGQSADTDYLAIEFVIDSKTTKQIGEDIYCTEYWAVGNNTEEIINGVSITVCYCDGNKNIVYTDTRTSEVSLSPGQSIEILSSSNKSYISRYVSNYKYTDDNRWIEVDCVANGSTFDN